jgi:hypothetical protein
MMQRDLAEFAAVYFYGMQSRGARDFVRDCQQGVEPLLFGDIQIPLQLLTLQLARAGFDLDECRPTVPSASYSDQAVRHDLTAASFERYLDETFDCASRRASPSRDGVTELLNG